MKTALRWISLILCAALIWAAIPSACAEPVSFGVWLAGILTEEDGTETQVRLEGKFRVYQNGTEAGIISAGGETITLPNAERIRIEPLPESIGPGWDLREAGRNVSAAELAAGMIPVFVRPTPKEPDPTPEPELPEWEPDRPEESEAPGREADTAPPTEKPTPEPVRTAIPVPTATPMPEYLPLQPGDNTGTVRILAFDDRNDNGQKAPNEVGMAGIPVFLLSGEEPIALAVTDDTGKIVFENVPEGTYRTRTVLPGGRNFTSFGGTDSLELNAYQFSIEDEQTSREFTVAAGQETLHGIGSQAALHVSGLCWEENTADGLFKGDDRMLPGVRITLDGEKNGLHYETVSGEDGTWYIDRVRPAFYILTAYVPEGMMFARYTTLSGKRSIITKDGVMKAGRQLDMNDRKSVENQYIGFARGSQVTGICYLDANYNGLYDEGEAPMAGVKVTAIKQANDEEIAVTRSADDGTFTLQGLRGGIYKIRSVMPDDGSTFTALNDDPLGNHFKSRSDRRENFWYDFELKSGETREIAIGAVYPATVRGTVYYDDDFSGSRNGNEKIVTSQLVTLLDSKGNVFTSDKTSIRGVYELKGVVPGEYTLKVTAIKGYAFTRLGEGNVILNRNNGEGYSEAFRVELGEDVNGLDIGMIRPGTVEGTVFADLNDNGRQDAGETGLPGVTVRLVSGEEEYFRAEIGTDGKFLFDAVMPGRYCVEYILPENAVFARTVSGGNTVSAEGNIARSEEFDFRTGAYKTAPLCGALTLGRIGGYAYQDHDGNGICEGEEPQEGFRLALVPARDDLEEITAETAADGSFAFENLRPGEYTLKAVCPDGNVVSRTDELALPLAAGKAEQEAPLPVRMGAVWEDQAIGVVMPAAIRGRVWTDENNNGIFDPGEKTPEGLAITITDEYTGRVFDTPVTDSEGWFAAAGMIPGDFSVSYTLDEDTMAPKPGDNQFTENNGKLEITGVRLMENQVCDGLLMGIVCYTRISGQVWIDRSGEIEPLSGAAITLTDGEGGAIASVISTESGRYSFTKLMPGTYRLEAEMPEGCVIIEPGDSRLNDAQKSVMTETVNRNGKTDPILLEMGRDLTDMDIGCVLPGILGDLCWLDLNGDGLQAGGEGGIPGVRIEALRDGQPVAEAVTDQYGFWRIPDLYPAAYTLRVTAPAEVKPTVQRPELKLIASVLEETEAEVSYSTEVVVQSDRANYNADIGFVLRRKGEYPAGYGEGKTQDWSVRGE